MPPALNLKDPTWKHVYLYFFLKKAVTQPVNSTSSLKFNAKITLVADAAYTA